ncbi:putative transcriptional regulator [Paenibacillus agaridevorans]|uniref:Putative transcriptional regulator n=1 Tax=Paenibacillus agaridevorans TaxID=171404 RepID=A0A2R5F1B0_9BACL|nr:winged helix DNA-binding protein [Paenibacillus agaridevorans]GBG09494.1 putative transcriptional regulator [Paenibacillus agaridevorans]
MKELTEKQAAALECIKTFIQERSYSPTTRELAKELGYQSTSTVHSLLDKLAEKGYISKEASGPRTIRILKDLISVEKAQEENERLRNALTKAEVAISAMASFNGLELMVHNWHLNGDGEPLDNFLAENGMDNELLETVRSALGK